MDEAALARVVSLAIKAETAHLLARIAVLEARSVVAGPPGERGQDGAPGPPGPLGPTGEKGLDGKDGRYGLVGQDGALGAPGPLGPTGEKGLDGRDGQHGRDGLVGRDGAPGLPGEKGLDGVNGRDGVDGLHGKDGLDGLGFPDLELVTDDAGRLWLRAANGVRSVQARVPGHLYRGVYRSDEIYLKGDSVTRDGSIWFAQVDEIKGKPGEADSGWQLAAKRGDQGKTGPAGPAGDRGTKGDKGDPGGRY